MPRKNQDEKKSTARKTSKPRVKASSEEKSKTPKPVRKKTSESEKPKKLEKKAVSGSRKETSHTKINARVPSGVSETPLDSKPKRSRLPRYGQTQLVAFVRDPNCIFTYWEVTPETLADVRRQLMDEYEGSSMVLRLLRTKADGSTELLEEITVNPGEMNRYVNLEEAGGSYILEIGHKAPSGKFVALARTNSIQTGPSMGMGPDSAAERPGEWSVPGEIQDYFSDEIIEQSFEPGKKFFSADLGGHAALHRRRLGPQDRHAASRF